MNTEKLTLELETRRQRAINFCAQVLDDTHYGGYAEMVRRRTCTAQKALHEAQGFLNLVKSGSPELMASVGAAVRTAEFWEI